MYLDMLLVNLGVVKSDGFSRMVARSGSVVSCRVRNSDVVRYTRIS